MRFRANPSANLLLAIIVAGFVGLVVGSVAFATAGNPELGFRVSLLLVAILMIGIGVGFLAIRGREYVLTTERVCRGVGPTSKRVSTVDLDRVEDVVLEQPTWQRWLGVGTIRFETDDGDTLTFYLVDNPQVVYDQALSLL